MIGDKISHYRILAQIGAGGMGVVYRARDEQLERDVAIKVLPLGLLTDEDARKRFRKEALALARLNHPNIATIYEFGQDAGRDFLVTEYIPGITLDAKLAAGPLGVDDLVDLGKQITTGLAAAHAQGLIHRDLKPANLRVMPDGRLKILDFGLAQFAARPSDLGLTVTLTRTQEVAGTLPYMAPEQLRGRVADARTDLWAVGAVLHEMATGKRPFPDSGAPVLIDAILNGTPRVPSKTNPKLPPAIDQIVAKALQKDASRRYQSAIDLHKDLEKLSTGARITGPPSRFPATILVGALMLGALLLLGGYFAWHLGRSAGSYSSSRRSVAVLGFQNLAANKDQSWLSTALSEMLTTELAAGEKLRTIPGENVARAKADLSLPDAESLSAQSLRKVNRILGADLVVLGSYLDLDGQVRVDVRVQNASAGDTVAKFSETGTEAQIFELVRRLGETLRGKCGAGEVTPAEANSIRATLPVNPEATKFYSQGLSELRGFNPVPARDLFIQAIGKDPNYALAHEALAEAWSQLGYDDRAKDESKRAFELASGLGRREALAIEARFRQENREWDKAIDIYRSLWTVFPDDPEYGFRLAAAQVSGGHGQDALATVDRLRQARPPEQDDPRIDLAEAAASASLSDYSRASSAAQTAIQKAKNRGSLGLEAEGLLQECWAMRNLGEPDKAKAAGSKAESMLASAGDLRGQARSLTCIANVLADQGNLSSAQTMHEQALQLARKIGAQKDIAGALINVGNVLASQQKIEESTREYKLSLALALSIGDRGDALLAQDNLGANFSLLGDYTNARKFFDDSVRTAREVGDQAGIVEALINLASVSYLQGDLDAARKDLDESLTKARALQLKSRLASAQAGMGDVLLAEDDIRGAQNSYQQSLAIRTELGEKGGIAGNQVSLAAVALENGQAAQAESLARSAAEEFSKENDQDQQAGAEDVLTRALISQQKWDEAKSAMETAKRLAVRDVPTATSLAITSGRLKNKIGQSAEAERTLQAAANSAAQRNLIGLEWNARLAMAESQIALHKLLLARANLQKIERDSARRGFRLLARQAARIAASLKP